MNLPDFWILDFDNTIVRGETLEILAELSLADSPQKKTVRDEIARLTAAAMSGEIDFAEALQKRLALLVLREEQIFLAIEELKRCITPSFWRHRAFFKQYADRIYVVSGGFRELIVPVIQTLGLRADQVYANELLFNLGHTLVGCNPANPLAQNRGKAKLIASLNLQGTGIVLGDGITDYEIAEENLHCQFYAFTENVTRPELLKKAKRVCASFTDFLEEFAIPFKKDTTEEVRILLLENVHPLAVTALKAKGFAVEALASACEEKELIERIATVHFLGVRSKTQVTEQVLGAAKNLLGVGAFCIGTDQIQLEAAANKGVVVFNAPFSSTRSVVELAAGHIIMLCRQVFDKSHKLHQGIWDKSTTGACEVRGKKLGIIGYGNIGSQLSIVAESLGMQVYYFDIAERVSLGNSKRCPDLKTLLNIADVVTLHVDGRPENTHILDDNAFAQMKEGSLLLNLSRGHVVNLEALARNLRSGKLGGAALDVYPKEPRSNDERFVSELQNMPNVILTPHIGGSTLEAQKNIGETVVARFVEYWERGSSLGSVNFPHLAMPPMRHGLTRIYHIHENVPGILAAINGLFGRWKINIEAQYLGTNALIGYVVTDVGSVQADCFAELDAGHFHPDEIIRIVDNAHLIGFRITDANGGQVW